MRIRLYLVVLGMLLGCAGAFSQSVRSYPVPKGYPYMMKSLARHFAVTANGEEVSLYNDSTYWGGTVDLGSFELRKGKDVCVTVNVDEDIASLEVLPKPAGFTVKKTGKRTIQIRSGKSKWQTTLVVNGDPRVGHVLHLFCNAYAEGKQPEGYRYDKETRTHLFGAGFYDLNALFGNRNLSISGNESIYLAPGAVVDGQLTIKNGNGARIYGNGMVCSGNGTMVLVSASRNSSVEDIMTHGLRMHAWQVIIDKSEKVTMKGMKIFNPHYASVDGIDIVSSSHCLVDSCFIRANDDAIAIKGLADTKPADSGEMTDLTFTHLQLWNDCNNAFGIGAETHCRKYSNISFIDSDVLFSYDDPEHHNQMNERSALNICSLHGTFFSDISFRNIRIYHCQRLIGLGFRPDFWFGSIPGDQTGEGEISNVTFKDIKSFQADEEELSNRILLYDWQKDGTPDKLLRNITFDNVQINGKRLKPSDTKLFQMEPAEGHDLMKELIFK